MMTIKEAKKLIDCAFQLLSHAVEPKREASECFERAYAGALAGEKRHRRGAWVPEGPYRSSIQTSARYFVVQWYFDPAKVRSALEAVSIREDALYASAVREALGPVPALMALQRDFAEIDYAQHLCAPPLETARLAHAVRR